jgi:signal transduction histidine kinase
LGLWISKGIVQKYGGSIRFRSLKFQDRPITCFQVTLPEIEDPAVGISDPSAPEEIAANR